MKKVVKLLLAICLIAPALISPLSAVNALESATSVPESVDESTERIQEFETEDDLTSELSEEPDELRASIPTLLGLEVDLLLGVSEELDELLAHRQGLRGLEIIDNLSKLSELLGESQSSREALQNLESELYGNSVSAFFGGGNWTQEEIEAFWVILAEFDDVFVSLDVDSIELASQIVYYYWLSIETGEDLLSIEFGINLDDISKDDIIAIEDNISALVQIIFHDFVMIHWDAMLGYLLFEEAFVLMREVIEGMLTSNAQIQLILSRIFAIEGQIFRLAIGGFEGEIDQSAATITFIIPSRLMNDRHFSGVITNYVADGETLTFVVGGNELSLGQGDVVEFGTGDLVYVI